MGQLKDVNMRDIPDAVRLGCRTMQSVFNADDDNIPFFQSQVWPQVFLGPDPTYQESHVPGRHLDALLKSRDVLGAEVSEAAIENHRRAAFFSYSGPVPFPLNRERVGGPLIGFFDHNLREGFHALHALVRYCDDDEAGRIAERSIEAVFDYWDPKRGWDTAHLEALGLKVRPARFIQGPARAIGPLVKCYRATGHARALELAVVLARKALDDVFLPDGSFDPMRFAWHTHSTTCTMSSLAQLADLLRDTAMMERVRVFYENGLRTMRDELGWVIEQYEPTPGWEDRGECNNTGDIIETALVLGRWGYDEYYHDAERILRGHLLPSQLRDVSWISEPPNPQGVDGLRNVADRHRGAFGFPAPYGHHPIGVDVIQFCMDIVGGAVGSLCEAWREAVTSDDSGHHVNLLFDRETDAVRVESPYTCGALGVTVRKSGPLWVRIPPWTPRESLRVTGAQCRPRWHGDRLLFAAPPVGERIRIEFPLVEQTITMHHRRRDIRVRLRGDEVVAMDNFGADLTFFPPME